MKDKSQARHENLEDSLRASPGVALPPSRSPTPPPLPPPSPKMFAARTSLRAVRSARPQVQSRLASTTTESAKEAAVSAAAKAQAAAGPALEKGAALWKTASDSAGSALGGECRVMGSVGRARADCGFRAAYKEPILGNVSCAGEALVESRVLNWAGVFLQAAVAREVLKQVYVAEKLSPPSLAQVTHTCEFLFDLHALLDRRTCFPSTLTPCCDSPHAQPRLSSRILLLRLTPY